jgi:hypothetical protein
MTIAISEELVEDIREDDGDCLWQCPLREGSGRTSEDFQCSLCDGAGTVPEAIAYEWSMWGEDGVVDGGGLTCDRRNDG